MPSVPQKSMMRSNWSDGLEKNENSHDWSNGPSRAGQKPQLLQRYYCLLQRPTNVIDSQLGVIGIKNFEYDIVAGFQFPHKRVELVATGHRLAVDLGNDKAGLHPLKIGEGAGAHRFDDHALGMNLGCRRRRD